VKVCSQSSAIAASLVSLECVNSTPKVQAFSQILKTDKLSESSAVIAN